MEPLMCLVVVWLSICEDEGGDRRLGSSLLGDITLLPVLRVVCLSSLGDVIIEDGIIGKQVAAEGEASASTGEP